jgi:hypothetical protein
MPGFSTMRRLATVDQLDLASQPFEYLGDGLGHVDVARELRRGFVAGHFPAAVADPPPACATCTADNASLFV